MSGTLIAVVAGIIGLTALGIGLGIAIPALTASESGAPTEYTDSLGLSYMALGIAPVALVVGLFFGRFAKRG